MFWPLPWRRSRRSWVPEMLCFHDISDLSHAPDNLLPAGLSALLAPPGAGRSRVIYQQQSSGQTGALAVGSLPEPLLTLMEQDRLGAALTAMGADPAAGAVLAGRMQRPQRLHPLLQRSGQRPALTWCHQTALRKSASLMLASPSGTRRFRTAMAPAALPPSVGLL